MGDTKQYDATGIHVISITDQNGPDFLKAEEDHDEKTGCNPFTSTLLENNKSAERLDIRHRIRINQKKLDLLLNQNPLSHDEEESEETSDLPFHSGPLRLSIFREPSPSTPLTVDSILSDHYDAAFQSFLKHRPLSENYTQSFSTYDFSSSSDDEVSEPQPESPLNLSDTDSIMSTDQRSPGIFSRRRNKLFSSSQSNTADNRPRSLYDSAKPRPPKEHQGAKERVGEKLNKLMQFRKRSKSTKSEDYSKNSYEKSYEPVPPNVTWTNVIAQSTASRFQPHPPATQPTNIIPNPKKKRHAPKPPTNVQPYSEATAISPPSDNATNGAPLIDICEGVVTNSVSSSNSNNIIALSHSTGSRPVRSELSNNRNGSLNTNAHTTDEVPTQIPHATKVTPVISPVKCTTPPPEQSPNSINIAPSNSDLTSHVFSHITPSCSNFAEPSSESSPSTETLATRPPSATSETPPISTVLCGKPSHDQSLNTNRTEYTPSNSCEPGDTSRNIRLSGEKGSPANDLISNPPLISLQRQKLVVEKLLEDTKATESCNSPLSRGIHPEQIKSPAKLSESRDLNPSKYYRYSEGAICQQSLQGTELIVSLILDDLVTAVDTKLSLEAKRLNQSHRSTITTENSKPHFVATACKSLSDDVTDGVDNPHDKGLDGANMESKKPRLHKHRISMDNASSGYSSPGSGDETPLSPENPISPLTVHSPTSSYYSASLSASSSRVSNLSRELTLSKSPVINENIADVNASIVTNSLERPLATPAAHPVTSARVSAVSSLAGPVTAAEIADNGIKMSEENCESLIEAQAEVNKENVAEADNLSDIPVKFRNKPTVKVRSKSEYIPYRSDHPEFTDRTSTVSICMVEKPAETASLSRAQARLYHQKGSRKKALAAGQKSRAFAMRAKLRWPRQRHSYAESSVGDYILEDNDHDQSAPSSNLVSHFVSTRDISTYYNGTEYKTITANDILHSKREEIFNAYKHASVRRNTELIGGSVRHLPVSTKEFGFMNDIIQEELDSEPTGKTDSDTSKENQPHLSQAAKITDAEKSVSIHRQPSEASSSSSGGTRYSPVLHDSTWSIGGDLSNQNRQRKPSLRKRIQSAFSFQNIRKAMSMEKLNEEEKQRSMSHHYLNENGSQYLGARERSATLQEKSVDEGATANHEQIRKAPSISSLITSVRMRKRHSRAKTDKRNRHTIADPESFAKNSESATKSKGYHSRPASAVLSNSSRRRLEDVGNPSYFRPIGRVLQMNPADGTLLVEMVKPSSGPFGFYIARKKESGDHGSVFISRLSDSYPDKMFAGLMRTGDEITEVNGTSVSGLTLDQVYDLILDSDKTLLKLKPTQVHIV